MARRSALRRAISFLVMAPATVILVLFAVSNREPVLLSLWPLSEGVAAPLYLVVVALLAIGIVIGMAIAWASGARSRREVREARDRAEREARELSRRLAAVEQELAGNAAPGPPPASRSVTTTMA
ncbi:MAG: LapA family protein [Proteobacteria bacterium]|nr:LapA family protein [Pseudomonadota bacterium]MBI3498525.1 LapA family protein [Pseudomonadota bacterium]